MLVQDGYDVLEAQEETTTLMRERRRIEPGEQDNFAVVNFADMIKQRAAAAETMSMLLAFTAAVSLIVGGVGVMNIMLVSVTERTREIGLRMAIGARGGDILLQFLFEAIALCTLGGLIGMANGMGRRVRLRADRKRSDDGLSRHHRDGTGGGGLRRSDIRLFPCPPSSSTRSNPGAET